MAEGLFLWEAFPLFCGPNDQHPSSHDNMWRTLIDNPAIRKFIYYILNTKNGKGAQQKFQYLGTFFMLECVAGGKGYQERVSSAKAHLLLAVPAVCKSWFEGCMHLPVRMADEEQPCMHFCTTHRKHEDILLQQKMPCFPPLSNPFWSPTQTKGHPPCY